MGPLIVTPIVAFIHQIPVVSDVLHPLIGYPVRLGLPAGTPVPRDVKVTSFDGTRIYTHFMPALGLGPGQTAPTILNGPGLGLPGATNLVSSPLADAINGVLTDFVGQVGIGVLRAAGYNVVTWDPRGEWNSGGRLELNSPDFEARDVSAILSWVAAQPEVQLDDPENLDPRIGMVGVSYGGGIQTVTAATDHRVDAIVPTITWNTLNTTLYKSEAYKSSWGTLLSGALIATLARVNPRIYPAAVYGALTGLVTPSDQQVLTDRGPGGPRDLVNDITAPTLLIQGTVDTIFSLQEADDTAQTLIANGVPTKVLWFCGGHGVCLNNLFDFSDGAVIQTRTLEWLDRYVKDDLSVSTGPQFEWVDQRGQWFSSEVYPVSQDAPLVTASSAGAVLPLIPYLGGSGLPVVPLAFKALNAVNLTVPEASTPTYLVGAPELTLTYSGTGTGRHVYAQLVDDTTGLVLGSIVTPIPVTLDGQPHTITIDLEPVAHTLAPGETVTLQLVSAAGIYETVVPSLGTLKVSSMQIALPTVDAAATSASSVVQPMSA
ncbi:MAG: X-Pro dipeptidyl-peptidase [Mycobacterium sp.]|nr:X-Pro dipeptidyl-peptidase [Mycobacterium sp.]